MGCVVILTWPARDTIILQYGKEYSSKLQNIVNHFIEIHLANERNINTEYIDLYAFAIFVNVEQFFVQVAMFYVHIRTHPPKTVIFSQVSMT